MTNEQKEEAIRIINEAIASLECTEGHWDEAYFDHEDEIKDLEKLLKMIIGEEND